MKIMKISEFGIRASLLIGLIVASSSVLAQVPLPAAGKAKPIHDGITLYERVSMNELNRIHIVDGRIKMMHFKTQELDVSKDEDTGQAFFTPKVNKTISVFITTEKGATFTLVLQPIPDVPAVNLAFKEGEQGTGEAGSPTTDTHTRGVSPVSSMSYEQAISTLILAAATNQSLPGVSEQQINQAIPLWDQTHFLHLRTLTAAGMRLAEFRLTNTGVQTLRMTEQELYKPGVLAVAMEQQILAPGEATPVFVVMGGEQ